jgi:hypothetical protein
MCHVNCNENRMNMYIYIYIHIYTHIYGFEEIWCDFLYVHGSMHRESVSIIVQQDATLYSFYSLQTALHVSGDIFTHHKEHE